MEMKMKGLMALYIVLGLLVPARGLCDPGSDLLARSKSDVGRTFWIGKPRNKGIDLCDTASGSKCKSISSTSFTVLAVVPSAGFPQYRVRTATAGIGFVSWLYRDHFRDRELTAAEQAANQACEENDAPSIDMSTQQVEFCLGTPSMRNTATTAAGVIDQWIYQRGGAALVSVYIGDQGHVIAVRTLR
jgi:hypothetical protein